MFPIQKWQEGRHLLVRQSFQLTKYVFIYIRYCTLQIHTILYVSVGTKSQTRAIRNYLVEGKLARQYTYFNFRERCFKRFSSVIIDLVFR